ncbi:hypothetical protein AAVH_11170 [Aphelenchoides avenae]|nr:hypothetical protein AAVH_11170 [Aphelenchus avenae]
MIAPGCIIPHLFGVDVVETCTITTELDPRPWIVRFTETFKRAERGTNSIRSASLLYKRYVKTPPLHNTLVNTLGQPRRTNAPTPHSAFIKEWLREECLYGDVATESNFAELFVFENANSAKKLEVFAWSVEQVAAFHYAFLLQVVDV